MMDGQLEFHASKGCTEIGCENSGKVDEFWFVCSPPTLLRSRCPVTLVCRWEFGLGHRVTWHFSSFL